MKFISLALVLLLMGCLPVQAKDKILDIQEVKSKNGLTAWLVEDHSLPIIALQFSFEGAGAIHDGNDKQGISLMLSNTLDEGAGELSSQEFQKKLADKSITLNFGSGRDNFSGFVKTLTRHKDDAFSLLKLALTQPRFDAEPLERMRQANMSRIRSSMGTPNWIAARLFNDKAFEGHPYALNSGGTLTTLASITADDLRHHLSTWLTQDRLHIGVMGDITKEELAVILDDIFDSLPKENNTIEEQSLVLQNKGKTFVYEKDIPQTILTFSLPSIKPTDPDYYSLQVMNYIFGAGGFGSRLMEEAREKQGLTYGIYSTLSHQDDIDLFNISTSTKNETTKTIEDIIKAEIQRIKDTPVSEEELNDSKSYLTGSMPLSLSSTDRIAATLVTMQENNRPIDYLDHYHKKINAVTIQDIQNVAKRILKPEEFLTIMVGKPENVEKFEKVESLNNVE